MVRDNTAMNEAALGSGFDKVRFRVSLIASKEDALGYEALVVAAARLVHILVPVGTRPATRYVAAMLRIEDELDAIGFTSPRRLRSQLSPAAYLNMNPALAMS
ncbi:hypothetical protein GCM10009552_16230 [Rothia nasimurium]